MAPNRWITYTNGSLKTVTVVTGFEAKYCSSWIVQQALWPFPKWDMPRTCAAKEEPDDKALDLVSFSLSLSLSLLF